MKPETRLYVGLFCVQTAMMVGMAIIPFLIKNQLGGQDDAVALAYGIQNLGLGIVCLLSAPFLARTKNSAFWAFIGSLGFGVLYTACVFCHTRLLYNIVGALSMAGLAIAWPAMLAWLGGQPDEKLRARSLSYFNVMVGLGLIAGALLAGPLYDADYRLAFVGVGVMSAMGVYALFTLPRERDYFGAPAEGARAEESESKRSRANEAHTYCIWLAAIAAWGLVGATRTVYPAHIEHLLKTGTMVVLSSGAPLHVFAPSGHIGAATLYSWTQAGLSLAFLVAALAMGRTTFWERRFWLLALIQAITAGAVFCLVGSRSLLLIVLCHLAFGGNAAFCNLAAQFYSVANPALKHKRSAINQGLISTSSCLIPLAVAQLAVRHGPMAPFRFMPVAMAVVIGAEGLLLLYGIRKFVRGNATTREARVDG